MINGVTYVNESLVGGLDYSGTSVFSFYNNSGEKRQIF